MDRAKEHAADMAAYSEDRDARLVGLASRASSMASELSRTFTLTPPQALDQRHLLGLLIGIAGRRLHVNPSGALLAADQDRRGYLEIAALALALADDNRPERFKGLAAAPPLRQEAPPRPPIAPARPSTSSARPEEQHSNAPIAAAEQDERRSPYYWQRD